MANDDFGGGAPEPPLSIQGGSSENKENFLLIDKQQNMHIKVHRNAPEGLYVTPSCKSN